MENIYTLKESESCFKFTIDTNQFSCLSYSIYATYPVTKINTLTEIIFNFMETRNIPREKSWDSTLALMREGYTFIKSRCEAHHSDIFKSRIMGQRTIFMTGEEASALFYDNKYFIRKGATPKRVQNTLFGQKGVQTLDDEAHRKRKEMFMSLMSAERLKLLADITREKLREAAFRWEKTDKILMLDAAQEVMCRVA